MSSDKYFFPRAFFLISVICASLVIIFTSTSTSTSQPPSISSSPTPLSTPITLPPPPPTATPTPKPLTLAQMNSLYGPCIRLPVLYYHHVEPAEVSSANRRSGLAVTTELFEQHLLYLTQHNYTSILPTHLINFFDSATPLPSKPVLITFDDGYVDMYTHAYPLLQKYSLQAAFYLPTGLLNNPGYLSWDQVQQMAGSGKYYFGNHTWSHKTTKTNLTALKFEITTADTQLHDRGLNNPPTFVYPYGAVDNSAVGLLQELNYKLAFTTHSGDIQCKQLRYFLPRIHIGKSALPAYGL